MVFTTMIGLLVYIGYCINKYNISILLYINIRIDSRDNHLSSIYNFLTFWTFLLLSFVVFCCLLLLLDGRDDETSSSGGWTDVD